MSAPAPQPLPPLPPMLPALAHIAWVGLRQTLAQRAAWLGRSVFLVLILVIFSRLWQAVEAEGHLPGIAARDLIWYLAVTEWIVISLPLPHLTMEADVRSGEIAAVLTRPVPWLAARIAEALGSLLVRLTALGLTGFTAAYLLSGGPPRDPLGLLLALPLGLLAGVLGTLTYALVGLSTFWLGDCTPVAWVVQKLLFLLGGMILPLALYPALLRDVAEWTPFAAMLSGPGNLVLGREAGDGWRTLCLLFLWILAAALVLRVAWARSLRRLDGAGG